jgi:hypothetical protein
VYIDPFWAGVSVTLLVELVIVVLYIIKGVATMAAQRRDE